MNRLSWLFGFAVGLCALSIYAIVQARAPSLGFADPITLLLVALWFYRTGDSFWPKR
ncbi:MAG: hypothetical protein HY323_07225 [Betaproteobacteria bacterium]|nr:hypothetical protein [Betaproteobacteria bacterium]